MDTLQPQSTVRNLLYSQAVYRYNRRIFVQENILQQQLLTGGLGYVSHTENMPSISPHDFLDNDSKGGTFATAYEIGLPWAPTPQSKYSSDDEFKVLGTIMQTIMGRDDSVVPSGIEHTSGGDYCDSGFQSCITSSFEDVHPHQWNSSQVLEWLYHIFTPMRDYERLPLGNFRSIRGQDLVSMKREEFCSLLRCEVFPDMYTDQCADRAYAHLQELIRYRSDCSTNPPTNNSPCPQNNTVSPSNVSCLSYEPPCNSYPYDNGPYEPNRTSNFNTETSYQPFDPWVMMKRPDLEDFDSAESSGTFSEIPTTLPGGNKPPNKRGPGRPPGERKKKSKGQRSSRLWEFIRDLLKNKETCPRLVKWEDREEGVFRFVQSDQVAKLWGERKSNPRMTYEKLSRAMRYYYKSNVLQPVLGRRLVYKFGPCATGWRPHEM